MIPIQNIYYMLSYAFQTLKADSYSHMETEEFSNVADLCAAIGADRQAMDDRLQQELGMDGEELMRTFRQRDFERWGQCFGIRVEIY